MAAKASIEEITPTRALRLLEKNENNRKVRQTRVNTYAADMSAGNWKFNGAPIILNGDRVLDGQHRLHACVKANKPFKTLVVTGVTNDAHKTIDTGLTRTLADELRWAGEENCSELAAVLNLLWKYDDKSIQQPEIIPSRATLVTYLGKHPEVRLSIKTTPVGKRHRIRATTLAATHFLIAREHGAGPANAFVERLDQGTDYVTNDPLLALRNYATTVAGSRMYRPNQTEWFAVCIKTANAWLLGREVRQLRWRRVGPQPEQFPSIVTREDVGDLDVNAELDALNGNVFDA